MPKKVNMVPPQGGKPVGVDEDDVHLYQKLGYHAETASEATPRLHQQALEKYYDTPGQGARAVWEGAKAGLTLGLSDLNSSRGERMRAKFHPGKRLAGEIGAIVGTSIAAPLAGAGRVGLAFTPAGAAAITGEAAGGLARAGLRRAVVTGAVEGSVQGMGQVVGNHGLYGDPLTAESLLAGAGIGSVLGGGAEGLGYGLIKGGRALGRAGAAGAEALRGTKATITRPIDAVSDATYGELRSIVGTIKAETKTAAAEAESLLAALKKHNAGANAAKWAGVELPGSTVSKAPASKGTLDIGPIIRNVKTQADELIGFSALDPALAKSAAKEISAVRKAYTQFDEVIKSGNVDRGLKYYDEYYSAVDRLATKLGEPMIPKAKIPIQSTVGSVAAKLDGVSSKTVDNIATEAGKATEFSPAVMQGVEERLKALKAASEVSALLPSLPKAKADFFAMSRADRAKLMDALDRATGLDSFTPSAVQLKEKLAEITKKIGVMSDGSAAQQLGKALDGVADAPKSGGGKKRSMMQEAAARQAGYMFSKIAPGWLRPATRHIGYSLAKNAAPFAAGYALSGGDVKVGVAAALATKSSVRSRIKRAVGKLMTGAGQGLQASSAALTTMLDNTAFLDEVPKSKNLKEAAKARSEEIADLSQGRAASLSYAGVEFVREFSPETAELMEAKIDEVFRYLAANLPQDPGTVMIGGKSRWEMSEREARQAAETIYGAMHPLEALEDFVELKLSPYAMRSFRDMWPELHKEAVGDVMEQLPELLRGADASKRAHLSHILGVPISTINDPKMVKSLQEDLLNAPNRGMERQQSAPNKPSNNAQTLQSPAQRLIDR